MLRCSGLLVLSVVVFFDLFSILSCKLANCICLSKTFLTFCRSCLLHLAINFQLYIRVCILPYRSLFLRVCCSCWIVKAALLLWVLCGPTLAHLRRLARCHCTQLRQFIIWNIGARSSMESGRLSSGWRMASSRGHILCISVRRRNKHSRIWHFGFLNVIIRIKVRYDRFTVLDCSRMNPLKCWLV